MKKPIVVLIALLVVAGCLGGSYLMFGDAIRSVLQVMNAEPAVPQTEALREIVTVTRGDLEEAIHVLGTVYAPTHVTLSFDVDQGQIAEIYVRPGAG
jgi:multidrug efflux pump subunit AcrA (membrane-fusion protein)